MLVALKKSRFSVAGVQSDVPWPSCLLAVAFFTDQWRRQWCLVISLTMLTLPQVAGISNGRLVHTFLHQTQNFVVNEVKIWTAGRPSQIRREMKSGMSCWRGWIVSRARCAGAMSADKISRLSTAPVFRTCYFKRCHSRQRLTSADSTNTQENYYLPEGFHNYFVFNNTFHHHQTRSMNDMHISRTHKTYQLWKTDLTL